MRIYTTYSSSCNPVVYTLLALQTIYNGWLTEFLEFIVIAHGRGSLKTSN